MTLPDYPVPARRKQVVLVIGALTSLGFGAWAVLTGPPLHVPGFIALAFVGIGNLAVIYVAWPSTEGFLLRKRLAWPWSRTRRTRTARCGHVGRACRAGIDGGGRLAGASRGVPADAGGGGAPVAGRGAQRAVRGGQRAAREGSAQLPVVRAQADRADVA